MNSDCKRILSKIERSKDIKNELTKLARTAYLGTLQRGFIWLDFLSDDEATQFLSKQSFPTTIDDNSNFLLYFGNNTLPKYVCFSPVDIKNTLVKPISSEVLNIFLHHYTFDSNKQQDISFDSFNTTCLNYDPLNEFILLVSIKFQSSNENKNCFILKFSKIKFTNEKLLSINNNNNIINDLTSDSLILTGLNQENNNSNEEDRQVFLGNLLVEFETRGINLRTKYPKLYRDLCLYVEDNKHFTPVCLFPRDLNKNNLFMCLITPDDQLRRFANQCHSILRRDHCSLPPRLWSAPERVQ